MNGDPLVSQLRQFAEKLAATNVRLIIGGGYGLLLKANHIQRIEARTRLEQIPIARSTGDIDVFLTNEVIIDKNNMAAIRQALDELEYSPVPGAEYYQFFREITIAGATRNLKFDFSKVAAFSFELVKSCLIETSPVIVRTYVQKIECRSALSKVNEHFDGRFGL